jgi:alkylation response protein AidB-like acyl-CoA dehydrogenase
MPDTRRVVRAEVRAFLDDERAAGSYEPVCDAWLAGFSPDFSRKLGTRGWIGMTWSEEYGGSMRSAVERLTVAEELLAAGAPVAAHWFADRQTGPQIFHHGHEEARRLLVPIARGECYTALGLSEPESGSDLASVRTRAERTADGWRLSGTKIWSSHAHESHYISVLCRTSPAQRRKHDGLSILLVDLAAPGVSVQPIRLLSGEPHFNEVVFDDVAVPGEMLLGQEGRGWSLITEELALERSGAERFLSTMPLLDALASRCASVGTGERELGQLLAELATLRALSHGVAAAIDAGQDAGTAAALVKDLGTRFEQRVIDVVREVLEVQPSSLSSDPLEVLLAQATLAAPGFTLRGGTNEILRGIVARSVGLS